MLRDEVIDIKHTMTEFREFALSLADATAGVVSMGFTPIDSSGAWCRRSDY